MKAGSYAILACDVFQDELEHLAAGEPPWTQIQYLEMGLHDHPDRLRRSVQAALGELAADSAVTHIALAYGRCGNGLLGVRADRCHLVLPQAHDCVSVLLGGRSRHDAVLKENPGTYFYSPGWVRGRRVPGPDREHHLRDLYAERFGDDEEMMEELIDADRESFAHHNCAAYISIIDRPEAKRYCRQCAAHLGWNYRELEGDPTFLEDLVRGRWASPRFLVVPPGHKIGADGAGNLIAVP
ncbi:MAG: DUF1638 domain-containing protein [Opitutales bacterium]|nr:DUF1638 domain-containing protein [Opitutales bacterium]